MSAHWGTFFPSWNRHTSGHFAFNQEILAKSVVLLLSTLPLIFENIKRPVHFSFFSVVRGFERCWLWKRNDASHRFSNIRIMQGLLSWISLFRCKSTERLFYKQLTDLRYVIVQRFLGPCTLIADFFKKRTAYWGFQNLIKVKPFVKQFLNSNFFFYGSLVSEKALYAYVLYSSNFNLCPWLRRRLSSD